jgi:nucleotide-binding universal stress UspA family protein
MYRKILVPTDGSTDAFRAANVALELARSHGAQVKVVYAAYVPRMYETDLGTELMDGILQDGARILDDTVKVFDAEGIPVTSELVEGKRPVNAIVGVVEKDGIDLVVIASHGLDASRTKRLGSVTEGVLRSARCSVLLVK